MISDEYDIESGTEPGLKWSVIRAPKEGEKECGDIHLIKKYRDKVLLAVIDGLGHGKSAAIASQRAKYLLETFSNESLINVMNYCHNELKRTRGVVMSVAVVDAWEKTLTWIGVGNVQGVLLPANYSEDTKTESIILRNGIVGYKLPSLQASIVPISVGDTLIFATDGVRSDYISKVNADHSTEDIVEYISANYFKKHDDALILAARFVGEDTDVQTK